MLIVENKQKKGLCVAYRCMKKHSARDHFCPKHRKRYQKEKDPVLYTYGFLKQNAKRRKKPFPLTIEEFRQFCRETNYIELKGRLKKSATIDRIDSKKGYSIDNIQILSLSQNSSKSDKDETPF